MLNNNISDDFEPDPIIACTAADQQRVAYLSSLSGDSAWRIVENVFCQRDSHIRDISERIVFAWPPTRHPRIKYYGIYRDFQVGDLVQIRETEDRKSDNVNVYVKVRANWFGYIYKLEGLKCFLIRVDKTRKALSPNGTPYYPFRRRGTETGPDPPESKTTIMVTPETLDTILDKEGIITPDIQHEFLLKVDLCNLKLLASPHAKTDTSSAREAAASAKLVEADARMAVIDTSAEAASKYSKDLLLNLKTQTVLDRADTSMKHQIATTGLKNRLGRKAKAKAAAAGEATVVEPPGLVASMSSEPPKVQRTSWKCMSCDYAENKPGTGTCRLCSTPRDNP